MTESTTTIQSDDRPVFPKPITWRHFILFLIPSVIAAIEIPFAVQSWDFFYPILKNSLDILTAFFKNCEQFPGDFTIATILVIIWVFTPRFRRTIFPYLLALLIASLLVTVIKVSVGRARPSYGAKMEQEERAEIRNYLSETPNAILSPERGDYWLGFSKGRPGLEFLGWFDGSVPWWHRNHELSTGDYSSFPSGHSCSAFLLAAYLTLLFPRARWLWYTLAVGTALSRIRFRMHYPGDVLLGGAIGWIVLHMVFSHEWAFRWGDKVQRAIERTEKRVYSEPNENSALSPGDNS